MNNLVLKSIVTLREQGAKAFFLKARDYINKKTRKHGRKQQYLVERHQYVDVLFVNGCPLPHPYRYRVQHQREQLAMAGLSSYEVFCDDLQMEDLNFCRTIIIYRCHISPFLTEFVKKAKFFNKNVLFDIDDLVIDTKYTDEIPFVRSMKPADKSAYDEGVKKYGDAMRLCDAVITTTEGLAQELMQYMPEVIINRNTASEEMVALSEKARNGKDTTKNDGIVTLGYFSGSITHNDDINMILPVLCDIFEQYQNVRFFLVGEIDIPHQLKKYRERMEFHPFTDWKKLPELIAKADINIVPLCDTIFNAAKSENKWVEASLAGVMTIASDIGAFHKMIENGKTGILCRDAVDWKNALSKFIESKESRDVVSANALRFVLNNCVTINKCRGLRDYIIHHRQPNIAFVLPAFNMSGGILVALKHADLLRRHGYDVTLINDDTAADPNMVLGESDSYLGILSSSTDYLTPFDKAVATMWVTVSFFYRVAVNKRYYLVQNYEADFYERCSNWRVQANATYFKQDIYYITISEWCQNWLKDEFGQNALYAPNGIDTSIFVPCKRDWNKKIRILIEGDSGAAHKNVDESFKIVDQLSDEKFEVWYVSYQGEAKDWYRVDKFFHCVPNDEMPQIYGQCHILLKSSVLESFSYPPLEMMATGGISVVRPNEGNQEYLKDGINCLFYDPNDLNTAVEAINEICEDSGLRDELEKGGILTAEARDWKKCEDKILSIYT